MNIKALRSDIIYRKVAQAPQEEKVELFRQEMLDETEIIRDLVCSEKENMRFSPYDRYMLQIACKMLVSELMYVEDISYEFAKQLVKEDIEARVSGEEITFFRYV